MDAAHGAQEKIRILYLTVNFAESGTSLDLDEEMRSVKERLRQSDHGSRFDLIYAPAARRSDLVELLNRHRPQIVHFSGHGDQDGLYFKDESGTPVLASAEALTEVFAAFKKEVRLVVLNACLTVAQAEAITRHIPCAVGMSAAIGDKGATTFAAQFYSSLGYEKSVAEAFSEAKAVLHLEETSEHAVPQLFEKEGVKASEIFFVREVDEESEKVAAPKGWPVDLFTAIVPIAATTVALLLHVPYLSAEGAKSFPGFSLRFEPLLAAVVFVFLSGLPAALVALAAIRYAKTHSSGLKSMAAVVVLLSLGCSTVLSLFGPWFAIGLTGWLSACVGLGILWVVAHARWRIQSSAVLSNFLIRGLWLAGCLALLLPMTHNYSGSVLRELPVGGVQKPRPVRFHVKDPVPLRRDDQGYTETVLLLFEDSDDYWIKRVNDERDGYAVERLSRTLLGRPIEGGRLASLYERPRRWQVNAKDVSVRRK